ncbi:aspartyl protease family protein 2 [Castanea sativa]|uniref:aspartyl protease family protein 2 n=1 Tax=Castanea sativa TaxID=21020 RepID=UPI003F64D03C
MVSLSPLSLLLLRLLFLFTLTHLSTSQNTTTKHYYLKLPLLHKTPPPSPSQSLLHDSLRLSHLHHHSHHHLHRLTSPVISGASSGSGQYFISLLLGTPPQPLLLIADTASDLIWTHCSASTHHNNNPHNPIFFPRLSASFKPHHCFHPSCKLVPNPPNSHCNNASTLHTPCLFNYSYADSSSSSGFFSTETASFLSKHKHEHKPTNLTLSFGCGFWVSGTEFNSAQGVMGLGRGPISFTSQLGRRFGNKFSYCLKDYTLSPPPTSYLTIGGGETQNDNVVSSKMKFTPLVVNPLSPSFYYIGIKSVSVDGAKLRIHPSVWSIDDNGNGGTVIDSGTTLTFLAEEAYGEVVTAIRRRVRNLTVPSPTPGFELCVNESKLVKGTSLPRLKFELVGNSAFSPPPRNYFIATEERVMCLAIQPVNSETGFSVIGNLMQQGFLLEFDRDRSRLGFSRHGCDVP